jgi:hypothetical protein
METRKSQLHTINSSLPRHRTSLTELTMDRQAQASVALRLAQLAVHYYRPDFSELQVKFLIGDMVGDLSEFSVPDVEIAITAYRRDPNSKFFPTSGQLRKLASDARKDRLEAASHRSTRSEFGDSRPILWWTLPRTLWNPAWRAEDVPADHRATMSQQSI